MNACLHLNFNGKTDDILVTVFLNDDLIFEHCLDNNVHIINNVFNNTEDIVKQTIKICMHGKNQTHTVIDQQGNIIMDHAVVVEKVLLDDIDVTEIYNSGATCYVHNNNGHCQEFLDQFYGYIGCNGEVNIEWTTPLNLWFIQKCQ
jgi:hypothetical protein